MKQAEIIKRLSDDELRRQLLLSQGLFLLISIILGFILPQITLTTLLTFFSINAKEIFLYGILTALIVVVIEIILYALLPKRFFDDGGINEKIFKNQSLSNIVLICFIVAISEELLFRGMIQTAFGYIFASSLFAIVHIRYLKKPVLLSIVIMTSFLIGYLFEVTGNLLITIVFHFIVNFLLGLYIRFK